MSPSPFPSEDTSFDASATSSTPTYFIVLQELPERGWTSLQTRLHTPHSPRFSSTTFVKAKCKFYVLLQNAKSNKSGTWDHGFVLCTSPAQLEPWWACTQPYRISTCLREAVQHILYFNCHQLRILSYIFKMLHTKLMLIGNIFPFLSQLTNFSISSSSLSCWGEEVERAAGWAPGSQPWAAHHRKTVIHKRNTELFHGIFWNNRNSHFICYFLAQQELHGYTSYLSWSVWWGCHCQKSL